MPLRTNRILKRKPMRRRTRRKKVPRRRVYRKSYQMVTRRPYTKISRMPVSERYFTRLRYSEGISFTIPAALSLTAYIFQSSVYDPDFTSTGHQPLWRDTLATMYNRYRVFGIKYRVEFRNTNVQQMTYVYIKHSDNSTTETNPNTLRERGEGQAKNLDSLYGRANVLSGYLSVAKCHGLSKREFYDDDGFIAAIGANPAKMAYLQLYATTFNTSCIVNAVCDLEYYVEFMDRVDIAGS